MSNPHLYQNGNSLLKLQFKTESNVEIQSINKEHIDRSDQPMLPEQVRKKNILLHNNEQCSVKMTAMKDF